MWDVFKLKPHLKHVNPVFMQEDPVICFIGVVIAWETLFTQAVDTKTLSAQYSGPLPVMGTSQMAPPAGEGGNKTWWTNI